MQPSAGSRAVGLSTAPGRLAPLPHDSPPSTELTLRGRNPFSFFSKSSLALWAQVAPRPLGPQVDFRTPLPPLTIPSTVLAPWPFHFPTRPCVSEAVPEHFQRPHSSYVRRAVWPGAEAELSHQLPPSCDGPWASPLSGRGLANHRNSEPLQCTVSAVG